MFVEKLYAAETPPAAALTVQAVARRQAVENKGAYEAAGKALATLAINEARGQGTVWSRMYRSLLELETVARAAFRSELAKHNKDMSAHVKANSEEGTTNPAYAAAKNSANTRLSELSTLSKAMDAGVHFDKEWPFHYAVGVARAALRSTSQGDKRGRPAKPWMDKVKDFLSKTVPAGEWEQCLELVDTLAKVKE